MNGANVMMENTDKGRFANSESPPKQESLFPAVLSQVVAATERLAALAAAVAGPCPKDAAEMAKTPNESFASRMAQTAEQLTWCARSIDTDVQRIIDVLNSLGGL